jgi:deoxyribonuclease-4
VRLGAHVSIAGGMDQAPLRGREVGCDTIQVFTKSSRQWRAKPLSEPEIAAFRANLAATGIRPVVAHDCYLVNLAAPGGDLWRQSVAAFADELTRAEQLGIPYLVTHPGSHGGAGVIDGIARVAEALNLVGAGRRPVRVLLELTAGQGTSLGHRFEQLGAILELVEGGERLGVCLDTCHLLAAGYDIRTLEGYRSTLRQLDGCLGLRRVKVIHLNDSKLGLGSRVDRHAHIGEGMLGLRPFACFLNDPRLRRVPMILETPKDGDALRWDRRNLAQLRRLLRAGRGQRPAAREEGAA